MDEIIHTINPKIIEPGMNDLTSYVNAKKDVPFPISECPQLNSCIGLSKMLRDFDAEGVKYTEYGRLADHPDYRGYGLSKFLILAQLSYSILNNLDVVFAMCDLGHEKSINWKNRYFLWVRPFFCAGSIYG